MLSLTEAERAELVRHTRSSAARQSLALRCRIVLACAEGASNAEVGRRLGVTPQTVARWRARFTAERIAGLVDRPRSGAPRTVDAARIADVVTATVVDLCPSGTRWSRRSMARHTGLSPSTVARIWRAHGLKPHLFRPSAPVAPPDPVLGAVELVALHRHGPERVLALCIAREDRPDPAHPGHAELARIRRRAAAVRAALDSHRSGRTAPGLADFLTALDRAVPAGVGVHLVCDNHQLDAAVLLRRWQLGHPRFHLHFTPTPEFWANLTELKLVEMAVRAGGPDLLTRLAAAARRPGTFQWLRDRAELLDHAGAAGARPFVTSRT